MTRRSEPVEDRKYLDHRTTGKPQSQSLQPSCLFLSVSHRPRPLRTSPPETPLPPREWDSGLSVRPELLRFPLEPLILSFPVPTYKLPWNVNPTLLRRVYLPPWDLLVPHNRPLLTFKTPVNLLIGQDSHGQNPRTCSTH